MSPADVILKQFPNRVSLTVVEAGIALGYSRQTVYNMKSGGKFPIKITKVGPRSFVHIHDLITYLESGQASNDGEFAPKKKGRPSKADALRKAGLI